MTQAILHALWVAFAMGWEILWPLILGFALSGVVQAVVSHQEMSRLLPDDRPRSIITTLALGVASSSCSYAAIDVTRGCIRGCWVLEDIAGRISQLGCIVPIGRQHWRLDE
jgi:uncharacterized protein